MQTTKLIDFHYFQLSQKLFKMYAFYVSEGCTVFFLKVSERFF